MWCFYAIFQRCVSTMESSLNKEPLGKMDALWTVSVKMERLVSTDVTKGILFFNLDTHDKALYGSWFSVSKNMPFKWWRADIYDQQIYNVYFFVLLVEQVLTLNTVWKQSPRIPKACLTWIYNKNVIHIYMHNENVLSWWQVCPLWLCPSWMYNDNRPQGQLLQNPCLCPTASNHTGPSAWKPRPHSKPQPHPTSGPCCHWIHHWNR